MPTPASGAAPFESLDFIYTPTPDVDAAVHQYVEILGGRLDWKVRAMDTTVACLSVTPAGPAVLLAGHLDTPGPVLVYRVADHDATVSAFRAADVSLVRQLEIPHGPCTVFRAEGGQLFAVYELVRPDADAHFAGRIDP